MVNYWGGGTKEPLAKNVQHTFLIVASLYFYGYFNKTYLLLILGSIIINYIVAAGIVRVKTNEFYMKIVFIIGIIFNVGLLGFFKYYDFFISNVNYLLNTELPLLHILLPLGISFFTFQQLSFIVSIYKKEEKLPNFISYCLFVTFFPQLIAGPIVLYSEMRPQFQDKETLKFNWNNFTPGFYLFVIGMAKKLIIADTISVIVDNGYLIENLGFEAAWILSIAYTMQIYFDFSGYNDMAVGLGRMFNMNLPSNFNSPYKSKSITEFWRRWHITLGRALTTYVYIPLGGNRKGLKRSCINLMIVFVVSGIWHGANWTFILWGVLHGICVVIERATGIADNEDKSKTSLFLHNLVTFLIVNFLWIFFRAESITKALEIIKAMLNPLNHNLAQIFSLTGTNGHISMMNLMYALPTTLIALFIVFLCKNSQENYERWVEKSNSYVLIAVIFIVCIICMTRVSPFIYFNF